MLHFPLITPPSENTTHRKTCQLSTTITMKAFALLAITLASVTTAVALPAEDPHYRNNANLVVTR